LSKKTLALYGGKPVRDKPLPPMYPGAMFIDEQEEKAVLEVLRSKSLFRYYGPNFLGKVAKFEKAFANYIGVKHCLAVTSGTASLYVALKALGIGPGDEVIVPAYTWVSTAAMVVAVGATPVIVGIDESLTLSPEAFESNITDRTKVVIPVHMRGAPAKMHETIRIAKENDIKVLEDVAQACGGSYRGKKLGSIGDVGAFSFQLNKNMTAGEGGAVTTNDEDIYRRAVACHDVAAYYRNLDCIPPMLGLNFRMNEVSGAILIEQLKKLDGIVSKMRENKFKIRKALEEFSEIKLRELTDEKGDTGVCIVFFLKNSKIANKFARALSAENIGAETLYSPERVEGHIYECWKPLFGDKMKVDQESCKASLDLLSRAVHISVSPLLTEEDVNSVIEGIEKVAKGLGIT